MANENHCSAGPVSSLPGAHFKPEAGACCDQHEDRLATVKVQGETDSWGCEYYYQCEECSAEADAKDPMIDQCEWCRQTAELSPMRDRDEGMCGPVYQVCDACIRKEDDAAVKELEEMGYYDDDYDDD